MGKRSRAIEIRLSYEADKELGGWLRDVLSVLSLRFFEWIEEGVTVLRAESLSLSAARTLVLRLLSYVLEAYEKEGVLIKGYVEKLGKYGGIFSPLRPRETGYALLRIETGSGIRLSIRFPAPLFGKVIDALRKASAETTTVLAERVRSALENEVRRVLPFAEVRPQGRDVAIAVLPPLDYLVLLRIATPSPCTILEDSVRCAFRDRAALEAIAVNQAMKSLRRFLTPEIVEILGLLHRNVVEPLADTIEHVKNAVSRGNAKTLAALFAHPYPSSFTMIRDLAELLKALDSERVYLVVAVKKSGAEMEPALVVPISTRGMRIEARDEGAWGFEPVRRMKRALC